MVSLGHDAGIFNRQKFPMLEQTAVPIPLNEVRRGIRIGSIADPRVLRAARFVLIVRSDMPAETLRRVFPSMAQIGTMESGRAMVDWARPGIPVQWLPAPPRQLPFYTDAAYFELACGDPDKRTFGGFAIHLPDSVPDPRIELWASGIPAAGPELAQLRDHIPAELRRP